jgi:hypothetical protein
MPTQAIPRPYLTLLSHLYDAGGSAELDRYGMLVVGPSRAKLPGTSVEWLYLVGCGLVAGEAGRIMLTEAGRALATSYQAGRTRIASF